MRDILKKRIVEVRNADDETDRRTIEIISYRDGTVYAKEGDGFELMADDSDQSLMDLIRGSGFEIA